MAPLNDELPDANLFEVDIIQSEYGDILEYLTTNKVSSDYNSNHVKSLLQRSALYTLISNVLYKHDKNGILRRCIFKNKIPLILGDVIQMPMVVTLQVNLLHVKPYC